MVSFFGSFFINVLYHCFTHSLFDGLCRPLQINAPEINPPEINPPEINPPEINPPDVNEPEVNQPDTDPNQPSSQGSDIPSLEAAKDTLSDMIQEGTGVDPHHPDLQDLSGDAVVDSWDQYKGYFNAAVTTV